MKKFILAAAFLSVSLFAQSSSLPDHPSVQEFKQELGIKVIKNGDSISEKATKIYLVQHGSTEWSEIKRLQGWNNVPLSENGKSQAQSLAERIKDLGISAIYSSSLQSSMETGEILKQSLAGVSLVPMDELKGEFHGEFEGFTKEQYFKQAHFQLYYFLPADEEIFFPCGKGGESKADVARRAVPALKKIAAEHPGESVIVVSHGGLIKLINYYAGKFKPEETIGLPYGELMLIQADAETVYIQKAD